MRDTVPIKPDANAGRRVVRSLRIDDLRKGDALRIAAQQTMDISSTGYNVFIGTRLIVASSPSDTKTRGFVSNVVSNGGEVTEQNGFNCTRGQKRRTRTRARPRRRPRSRSARRCRCATASRSPSS